MRRPDPDEWIKLIADFETSELFHKDFAAEHDVSLSTFQYWLYKRNKSRCNLMSTCRTVSSRAKVIASPAPKVPEGTVEVTVGRGAQLRGPVGTEVRYVAELLGALQ